MFVGGLSYDATEEDVRSFFAECGEVVRVELERREDGKLKGHGHIFFRDAEAVKAAVGKSGQDLMGRWVKVNEVHGGPKPSGCRTVFVGGLPFDVDEARLKEVFGPCGPIACIRWGEDRETGDFKGYAHVEFETEEVGPRPPCSFCPLPLWSCPHGGMRHRLVAPALVAAIHHRARLPGMRVYLTFLAPKRVYLAGTSLHI